MTECNLCHRGSDIIITDPITSLKVCPNCATILNIHIPKDSVYDRVLHSEHFHLFIKEGTFIKGWYSNQNLIGIPRSALRPQKKETLAQILCRLNHTYKNNQVYCGGCGTTIHTSWIAAWTAGNIPYCRTCRPSLSTFGVCVTDGI